jgi:hypothetical protein
MQAVGVTEKRKIGGEVELVEIAGAVGQPISRDAQGVKAESLCSVGEIGLELSNRPLSVKCGDKNRAGRRTGKFRYRRGRAPEDALSDAGRLLNIGAGDFKLV